MYICDNYHNLISWFYTRFSGFIKLASGNLSAVISAIHFLYGEKPNVSINNAADIIEEAEFLMIDELKAYTIDKIKSMEVVAQNCLKLLLVSLRYDVKLERAETYFKAHLPEQLSKEEALLLDKEYVYSIFTDDTLSYVSRQDLFLFLVKWVAHCPTRNRAFSELMSALKLIYIRLEGLNEVDMDSLDDENQSLCRALANKMCTMENILIISQAHEDYKSYKWYLHAFNVDKNYWFLIRGRFGKIKAEMENKMALVYFKDKTLCKFNLGTNEESQKTFRWLDELDAQFPSKSSSNKNTCIRHMSLKAEKLYVVREARLLAIATGMRIVSTIYCSDKTDESKVYMKALIAVNGAVNQFGVTDELVCLIVKGSERLIVYAADEGIISTVDLSQLSLDYYNCNIFSAVGGGKIYITTNTNQVVQINIYKEGSAIKTSMRETVLKGVRGTNNDTRFEFTEDKIITVTDKYENYKSTLSYAYQKMPEDINFVHKEEKISMGVPEALKYGDNVHFLEAYLPSDAPRCHDKCPHCSFQKINVRKHISYGTAYFSCVDLDYDSD